MDVSIVYLKEHYITTPSILCSFSNIVGTLCFVFHLG